MFQAAIKKHAEIDTVHNAMPSTSEGTILDAFSSLMLAAAVLFKFSFYRTIETSINLCRK